MYIPIDKVIGRPCISTGAVYSPNFTWIVTSRHVTSRQDTTRTMRRTCRTRRDELVKYVEMSSRAWSDMADDKKAVMLACRSLVFCDLDLHRSQKKLLEK